MTNEFIYEFMYMKNIMNSYLNACVPRFQMRPCAVEGIRVTSHVTVMRLRLRLAVSCTETVTGLHTVSRPSACPSQWVPGSD